MDILLNDDIHTQLYNSLMLLHDAIIIVYTHSYIAISTASDELASYKFGIVVPLQVCMQALLTWQVSCELIAIESSIAIAIYTI